MSTETPRMATKPRGLKLPRKVGPFELSTIVAAVAILVAIFLPFFYDSGSGFMNDATVALVYVVMALGLNIVVGFAGLLDLGYVAFFAIGAYTMGWLGSTWFSGENIHIGVAEQLSSQPGIHLNWLIVLPIAAIAAATLGAILGFPTLRLRGDYIAIVTLAFGEIVGRVAVNSDDGVFGIGHFNLTNGRAGITPVDKIDIPLVERFTTLNLRPWYWTALALALVVLFINFRLRDSRIGRAWIAIREDEVAAVSMGIPTVRVKLLAYALGAAMGGMAGTFLGSFYNTVNADQFEFSFSIFVLAMIILGGLGSIWGVVVGALLLSYINTNLIPDVLNDVPSKIGLDFDLTELGFGIFGFLLVIMMVLRPQGLIPERRHQAEFDVAEPTEGSECRGDARMSTPEAQAEQDRLNAGPAVLETVYLTKIFGGLTAVDGVSFRVPEKVDRLDHRAERRREDDVLQHADRALQAVARRCHLRRQEGDVEAARPDHRAGGRADVPEHPPVRDDVGGRERAGRPARAPEGERLRFDPPHAAGAARGEGGAREGARAARLRRRREAAPRRRVELSEPTATSAGWRSPARSPRTRSCCCSTSRPRA